MSNLITEIDIGDIHLELDTNDDGIWFMDDEDDWIRIERKDLSIVIKFLKQFVKKDK